jgi:hypothetical protein
MNEHLTDEVVELAEKISALSMGYSNTAVLFAAISILAQKVAAVAGTESELVQFSGEIEEALGTAILACWKQKPSAAAS